MVVRAKMMVMKAVVEKTIAVTRAMVIELAVVAARVKTGAMIKVALVRWWEPGWLNSRWWKSCRTASNEVIINAKLSFHYRAKSGHYETSIIHFPTSSGVSE